MLILKETDARYCEASNLRWTYIDFERKTDFDKQVGEGKPAWIIKVSDIHTFRHWNTQNIMIYVKDLLGHKNLQSTQIYITIERAISQDDSSDESTVKVAKTLEEA